uniref:Uncharacterized protein n=1 Tax=Rangifer tarandus platyrhynchus TaxID=3082113 RepID=A0ACB0EV88_RANTA|nr:unnamed protein product [Rangifer tarandus platyrhynchus]
MIIKGTSGSHILTGRRGHSELACVVGSASGYAGSPAGQAKGLSVCTELLKWEPSRDWLVETLPSGKAERGGVRDTHAELAVASEGASLERTFLCLQQRQRLAGERGLGTRLGSGGVSPSPATLEFCLQSLLTPADPSREERTELPHGPSLSSRILL